MILWILQRDIIHFLEIIMALPGEEFSCTGLAITVNPEPARDDFGNTLVNPEGKPIFRLGFRVGFCLFKCFV